MKITGFSVYQVELPLKESSYNWSEGKAVSTFDSTVVNVHTDAGIDGWGEVCPLGPYYLPSYAEGVRTGLRELTPALVGENPLELGRLNNTMDYLLKGHPYVKSPVDMACWDVLGKFTKLPVCTLLGGRFGEKVELYRAISQAEPHKMTQNTLKYQAEGYTKFQLKLGGNPDQDILRFELIRAALAPSDILIGDANTGWLQHQALRVASAVKDLDVYLEQPCLTYEECLNVRHHTNLPFIIDESVNDMSSLLLAYRDRAADVVNLKISKFGGLTKTKQARDLCVSLGLAMTIEDTWGSDIATASIAHMAHSTPEKYRFSSTDFNSYNSVHVAKGGPIRVDGKMEASRDPGLGVTPDMAVLGDPVFTIGASS